MKPRPTLRDVAKRAEVSTAAVSLALRDHPRISAAVRERIKRIAEEIGYAPDPVIARLAANGWAARRGRGVSSVIGFVTGSVSYEKSGSLPELGALRPAAARLGYGVNAFYLPEYRSPDRLERMLRARGIRGLLLHQIADADFVRRFPWGRFATVACSASVTLPPVHVAEADYVFAAQESWARFEEAGYRRVGYALMKEMNPRDDVTRCGIVGRLGASGGMRAAVEHFAAGDREAFTAWAKRHRFDAVAGLNDGFYWALRDAGLRMPEDLGYQSLVRSSRDVVDISGWNACEDLVAKAALNQLDLLLRSGEHGLPAHPYTVQVRPTWNAGKTMRRAETEPRRAAG